MAVPGRKIDLGGENIKVPIEYKGPFSAGKDLVVGYKVDGGPEQDCKLSAPTGGGTPAGSIDVPEGAVISGTVYEVDGAGRRTKLRTIKDFTAEPDPGAPAAPASPAAPTPARPTTPDARVRDIVGNILEDLKRQDLKVQNLEARFEELKLEIASRPGSQIKFLLQNLAAQIPGMTNLAPAIREAFRGRPAPATVEEFVDRIADASTKFRHRVFLKLKADPEASKALQMKKGPFDPRDPLRRGGTNRIFDAVCGEYDLGGKLGAAQLGLALKSVDPVPPTDPESDKARLSLLEGIIKRKNAGKPGMLKKAPSSKLDKALEIALHTGGVLSIAGGGWLAGAAMLTAKPILEAATGIRGRDLVKAWQEPTIASGVKSLWKTFSENFFLADWMRSQKSLGSILKDRLRYVGRHAIPFVGPTFLDEEASVGGYEQEGEIVQTADERYRALENHIRKACTDVIGTP